MRTWKQRRTGWWLKAAAFFRNTAAPFLWTASQLLELGVRCRERAARLLDTTGKGWPPK